MAGYTARDIKEMSLWEFGYISKGFAQFNGGGDDGEAKAPSEDEFFSTMERLGIDL